MKKPIRKYSAVELMSLEVLKRIRYRKKLDFMIYGGG